MNKLNIQFVLLLFDAYCITAYVLYAREGIFW